MMKRSKILLQYITVFTLTVCVESQIVVMARVGSTVVLPCELPEGSSPDPYVQWNILSETVLERRGKAFYRNEKYEGRVDVPEDGLARGNCSLVMKGVEPSDEGVYESYLSVKVRKRSVSSKWLPVQSVKLQVDEKSIVSEKTPELNVYRNYRVSDDIERNRSYMLIVFVSSLLSLLHQF